MQNTGNTESRADPGDENQFSWRSTATTVLSAAEKAIEGLPVPGAKACISLVLKVMEASEIADKNEQLLQQLQTRCQQLQEFILSVTSDAPETIQKSLQGFDGELRKLSAKWERRLVKQSRKWPLKWIVLMLRLFNASRDRDIVETFVSETDQTISSFLARLEIVNFINLQKEIAKNRQTVILSTVKIAQYAAYNAARVERLRSCLYGTRKKVMETLDNWALDTDPNHSPIFWLNGLAGIGKTTIAHTLAAAWDGKHHLGGSFFFFHSDDQLKDARLVFPTLALQLTKAIPAIRAPLAEILEADPSYVTQSPAFQFDHLILKPLTAIPLTKPLILVLDALDECQPNELTEEIIRTLLRNATDIPFLRILVTSRPEAHIREALGLLDADPVRRTLVLHENIEVQEEVVDDIRLYLETSLQEIWTREKPDKPLLAEHLDILVQQSAKLFIYAATAVRFIGGSRSLSVDKQLSTLLKLQAHHAPNLGLEPYSRLDELYVTILRTAFGQVESADPDFPKRFKQIVGSIVLMQKRLPLESLAVFLKDYNVTDIRKTLYNVHSILVIPDEASQAIQTYHLSFPNFITNPRRCTYSSAYVNPQDIEPHLFLLCISTMKLYFAPHLEYGRSSSEVQQGGPGADHVLIGQPDEDDIQPFDNLDQEPGEDLYISNDDDNRDDFYEGYSSMTPEVRYSNNHWCSHLVNIRAGLDSRDATQNSAGGGKTSSVPNVPAECLTALESFLEECFSLWLRERVTRIRPTYGATKLNLAQDTLDMIHNAHRWLTVNAKPEQSIRQREILKSEASAAFDKLFPRATTDYVFGRRLGQSALGNRHDRFREWLGLRGQDKEQ